MKENMENDKYISCPICGKEKFSLNDYFIFCNNCGWEGSLNTSNIYVEEADGFSIRDYKKVYTEYLKINKNYIWKEDTEAINKFCDSFIDYGAKCPVCGEDSFEPEFRYCYKCGWKYNFVQAQYPDFDDSSNKMSLNQYKNSYNEIILKNKNYMWKDSSDVKIKFSDEQIKWLKENDIKYFDKLTPNEEIQKIFDTIEKIQGKSYIEKNTFIFINSILDIILGIL